MDKIRVDSKKPSIMLREQGYSLIWPLYNVRIAFPSQGYKVGDIIPCDITPYKVIIKNPRVDKMKLEEDVIRLVGLFGEKEIVTMVQALHPAATSREIADILRPDYKRIAEVAYQGGIRSGKTTAVHASMERDMEAKIRIKPGEGYERVEDNIVVVNDSKREIWVSRGDMKTGDVITDVNEFREKHPYKIEEEYEEVDDDMDWNDDDDGDDDL